jgi:membrane protease YdiL (CAAX protease family)
MINKKIKLSTDKKNSASVVPWSPWLGIIFAVLVFYAAQILSGTIVSIYPALKHWTDSHANSWLNNSVSAQFVYILLAESFTVGSIYLFLRWKKAKFSVIGLKKPHLSDPVYALAAAPVYFALYLIAVSVISYFVPSLNVNQQQQIGFNSVHGAPQLIMTFISLVVLPPIAEEIMVRGFIYSSLRKAMRIIPAALITSLIFASAHLPEGGSAGPLYIAAIDTFVLSLVLIYLREKTGNLWASMSLHALKNGVAFATLFLVHAR